MSVLFQLYDVMSVRNCPKDWEEMSAFVDNVYSAIEFANVHEFSEVSEAIKIDGLNVDASGSHVVSHWKDNGVFTLWYPELPINDLLTFAYHVDLSNFERSCIRLASEKSWGSVARLVSVFGSGAKFADTNAESWSFTDVMIGIAAESYFACSKNVEQEQIGAWPFYAFDEDLEICEIRFWDRVAQLADVLRVLDGQSLELSQYDVDIAYALALISFTDTEFEEFVTGALEQEMEYEMEAFRESALEYLNDSHTSTPTLPQILIRFALNGLGHLTSTEVLEVDSRLAGAIHTKLDG